MRWRRARVDPTLELGDVRAQDISGLEVIEMAADEAPARPPLDALAGLAAPAEAPYARPEREPTGSAGLWEALRNL